MPRKTLQYLLLLFYSYTVFTPQVFQILVASIFNLVKIKALIKYGSCTATPEKILNLKSSKIF